MLSSIFIFLIVLSILVLVHELGHFIVARKTGVLVEEFGFGLPPRIWGRKFGDTIYSINLLPFGGFVRLHGENTEDTVIQPEHAFINKGKRARGAIVISGVVMNFLLAVTAFSIVYAFTGIPRETKNVRVEETRENSPAKEVGIQAKDVIRKIDGVGVSSNKDFIETIEKKKGEEVVLLIEREGALLEVKVVPRKNPPSGEGALGVLITSTEIYSPPFYSRPFLSLYYGVKETIFWSGLVMAGFVKIISDALGGNAPKDVAGPVGIFALTSQTARFGILALINFLGILSVNLAVLNAIPFPALDGGRLLFIGIESLFGRKVGPRVEAAIHTAGMIILIILILAITAHDIQRLIGAGGVAGYIDSVLK